MLIKRGELDGEEVQIKQLPLYYTNPTEVHNVRYIPEIREGVIRPIIPYKLDTDGDGIPDKNEKPGRTNKWDVSDRHLAIASSLAYENIYKVGKIGHSDLELLNEISNSFQDTVNQNGYSRWSVKEVKFGSKGFSASLFEIEDNYIVSFRGTDKTELDDLLTDGKLGLGLYTKQNKAAFEFISSVILKNTKNNIYITGHSLGGNLSYTAFADAINSSKVNISKIKEVVTFNGAGIRDSSDSHVGETLMMKTLNANKGIMKSYSMEKDFLKYGEGLRNLMKRYDKSGKEQRVVKLKENSIVDRARAVSVGDIKHHSLLCYLEKGNFQDDIWYYN